MLKLEPKNNPTGDSLYGSLNGGVSECNSTDGKIKSITINIEKLVERFEIHSASVRESSEQVKTIMLETLMGALNDTQLTIS